MEFIQFELSDCIAEIIKSSY